MNEEQDDGRRIPSIAIVLRAIEKEKEEECESERRTSMFSIQCGGLYVYVMFFFIFISF